MCLLRKITYGEFSEFARLISWNPSSIFLFSQTHDGLLGRYFTCVYKVAATDRRRPAIVGRCRTATAHPSVKNHLNRQTGARINKVLPVRARQNLSSSYEGALRSSSRESSTKSPVTSQPGNLKQNKPFGFDQDWSCLISVIFFGFFI